MLVYLLVLATLPVLAAYWQSPQGQPDTATFVIVVVAAVLIVVGIYGGGGGRIGGGRGCSGCCRSLCLSFVVENGLTRCTRFQLRRLSPTRHVLLTEGASQSQ